MQARSNFVEAQKGIPKGKAGKAARFVNQIGKLYTIEKRAKSLDPRARRHLREQQSRLLIEQLRRQLDKSLSRYCRKARWARRCTISRVNGDA